MTRSTEFGRTVRSGKRTVQPDLVVYLHHGASIDSTETPGPRVGLIVGKSVGNAVVRHRVSRRVRHCVREFLDDLHPADNVVVRALPSSGLAPSQDLSRQLGAGLARGCRR